eukprot:1145636-Pelagomonas_calceolata.AAC.7
MLLRVRLRQSPARAGEHGEPAKAVAQAWHQQRAAWQAAYDDVQAVFLADKLKRVLGTGAWLHYGLHCQSLFPFILQPLLRTARWLSAQSITHAPHASSS